MQLIIAEKPSLARTIAQALGGGRQGNGVINGDDWSVTWAFGHMYEQAMPDEYLSDEIPTTKKGSKVWRKQDLPIIPQQWIMKPRGDAAKQLKVIQGALERATEIVHAGDPDREGQLLIDEILEEMDNQKPVQRIWLKDLTTAGIQRAFKQMRDNQEYRGLYLAALSRSRCDWTLGMNVTRAYTLDYQKAGGEGVISVGRVQTPTLNLIVERDREIEDFVPLVHFTVRAQFEHPHGAVNTEWLPGEEIADPEGRCMKVEFAEAVASKIRGKQGKVTLTKRNKKRETPPLPFALSTLQTAISAKWGYGAKEVLDIAQRLYEEHKLTTYPRTDCGFLSEGQHKDASAVLAAIGAVNPKLVEHADSNKKSKAFNDKKVTAHTGIIPTAKTPQLNRLSEKERNVYGLIARHYVAQFLPDYEFEALQIQVECKKERFLGKGKKVVVVGWREVLPSSKKEVELPAMSKGDAVDCTESEVKEKKTKPASRFTEGTLIKAMAGIARYVENPKVKAALKESAGIGTEATRASIIETLKERTYITVKGKKIISTPHGRNFIDSIPGRVKDPAVTAWWEQQMGEIAEEQADADQFMEKINGWMSKLVQASHPDQFKAAAAANPRKPPENGGDNPPTPKMKALAKKIAEEKGVKLPRGYSKSFDLTREFLDQQLGGKRSGSQPVDSQ